LKLNRHVDFLVAIAIVAVLLVLAAITYQHVIRFNFFVGNYRFSHWLSIIGSLYIVVATPIFAYFKRQFQTKYLWLIRFHMFGNLAFFTLITIHFAAQISRPASAFPDLGTGLALFIAMSLQVASGFTQRFKSDKIKINSKANRFLHVSLIVVFYFVIVFHVLHGFGLT
jgi:hypothetical protein